MTRQFLFPNLLNTQLLPKTDTSNSVNLIIVFHIRVLHSFNLCLTMNCRQAEIFSTLDNKYYAIYL